MVAIPRNEKKPAISVTVVNKIDEDVAGSWPKRVSKMGMTAPANPAETMAITIDTAMTPTSGHDPLQT